MNAYIDGHRNLYGVEPICKVLQVAPSAYRRHAACVRRPELRSCRVQRDEQQMRELEAENARLKRMYADLALENAAIKDVLSRKS